MLPEDIPLDHPLGPHVDRFEVRKGYLILGSAICAATALIAIAVPIFGFIYGDKEVRSLALCSALALILLGLSAYLITHVLRHVDLHVDFHRDGFVILRSEKYMECRWHEIVKTWYKERTAFDMAGQLGEDLEGKHALTIQRTDGVRLKLTAYLSDFEAVVESILEISKPYLLSAALKSYRNGETVDFDRMSVSQHGIMNGKKLLSWDDFGSIKIESGRVFVRRRHGRLAWFGIPAHKVANAHVLVDFVSEVCPE
jgi:hypothetical protein